MSIDSQETEDENDSGKGSGAESLPPPLSPSLGNDVPPDETNDSEKGSGAENPPPPSPSTLSHVVPQDDVNDSGKGSGEKELPLLNIHLESDDNSYDSKYLTNLDDQIKSHEAIAAQDTDKHDIELKKLQSTYGNALKAKKNYDKKKK